MIPKALTGSDFEEQVFKSLARIEQHEIGTFGRYGVQAVRTMKEWQIMQSLPDIEGIIAGLQHIFDCKVCTSSSFSWAKYRQKLTQDSDVKNGSKARQLRHLRKRSKFGAKCGFLIHWNERVLVTKTEPAITYWFPVIHDSPYWGHVDAGELKSLTREDCRSMGIEVPWRIHGQDRTHKLALEWLFTTALPEYDKTK